MTLHAYLIMSTCTYFNVLYIEESLSLSYLKERKREAVLLSQMKFRNIFMFFKYLFYAF